MPLVHLYLSNTRVADLSPLKDMPLESLHLDRTAVADLKTLKGMPLRRLRLDGCSQLTDLSPLAHCQDLEVLILPTHHGDIEFLRKLPKLRQLSYHFDLDENKIQTTANFWATRRARR
jgi:Leucine-rich repeat (LRR) protein